jgi:hypothetical protein
LPTVSANVVPEQDPSKRTIIQPVSKEILPVFTKDKLPLQEKLLEHTQIQDTVTLHFGQGIFFPVINTFSICMI